MKQIQYGVGVLLTAAIVLAGFLGASAWLNRRSQAEVQVLAPPAQVEAAAALQLDAAPGGKVELLYGGTGVYSDPLPAPSAEEAQTLPDLGEISLFFLLDKTSGADVTGYVDLRATLTFTAFHTIQVTEAYTTVTLPVGPKVDGTYENGVLNLLSETFNWTTESGEAVQRQFRLTGSPSPEPGILTGEYRETIWGFGLEPVTIVGDYRLKDLPVWKTAQNKPPVADPQAKSTTPGAAVNITLTGSDPEEGALSFAIAAQPLQGTLNGTPPNITYTPKQGFLGADSFTFVVDDGVLDSEPAAVVIEVSAAPPANRAPNANAHTVNAVTAQARQITLAGSDLDGDTLSFSIVTQPTHGTLAGTPPNVTYTSAAGYTGPDSFTFKVNDGKVDSPVATVSIEVSAAPPTGEYQLYLPVVRK